MSQDIILDSQLQQTKNLAWWLYLIHGASFVFSLGAFSFIPLIINYVKRDEAAGTFVYSHHSWMIRSFWWYVAWIVVGAILWITLIGIPLAFVVWGVAWLWKAYRLLRGFLDLNNNTPSPCKRCFAASQRLAAAYIAANARSISAIKSCGSSSPTFRRTSWPGNCQPLRMAAMRYGITRLFAPPQL